MDFKQDLIGHEKDMEYAKNQALKWAKIESQSTNVGNYSYKNSYLEHNFHCFIS